VIRLAKEGGKGYYVAVRSTLFHPKSGGQPSDTGYLVGDGFRLQVRKAIRFGKTVVLWGRSEQSPKLGEAAEILDWERRYLYMRRHAAAHLFDAALDNIRGGSCEPTDSWLGDDTYVGYRGDPPDESELERIKRFLEECVGKDLDVRSWTARREEVNERRELWRAVLKELEFVRLVQIDGFSPVPCGGTHVRSLREVGGVTVKKVERTESGFRFYYDVSAGAIAGDSSTDQS
jgi:alanyl-tRNA synthetase